MRSPALPARIKSARPIVTGPTTDCNLAIADAFAGASPETVALPSCVPASLLDILPHLLRRRLCHPGGTRHPHERAFGNASYFRGGYPRGFPHVLDNMLAGFLRNLQTKRRELLN